MAFIRLTKEFSFEMAHMLGGYDGACSQIHGHSYRLFVTVSGEPNYDPKDPKLGMVMDFRVLKKIVKKLIVDRYDHTLVLRDDTDAELRTMLGKRFERLIFVDYQPTCENMIARFAEELTRAMPTGIKLHSLRLHETATSFAEWFAADNL